jgi:hypothetical protein
MQGRALRKSPAQMRTMKGKIWNNKMETDETFSLNKIRKKRIDDGGHHQPLRVFVAPSTLLCKFHHRVTLQKLEHFFRCFHNSTSFLLVK